MKENVSYCFLCWGGFHLFPVCWVFFLISASIEMIMCFSLIFWMWCIMLINFVCWNLLHSMNKLYLVMLYNPFTMRPNSVCYYFVEGICINIHKTYCFIVSLPVYLSDFGITVILVSWNELGCVPSSSDFWKSLRGTVVYYSWNIG